MADDQTTSNPAKGAPSEIDAQMGRLAEAIRELPHMESGGEQTSTVTGAERAVPATARVGHYQLTREIDAGGMGFVYEAIQDQPRRTVAVKLMRHSLSSKAALRRFEYESQILARLHHPGIAQIFEAGTHQHGELSIPFFAMEFIPGARPITSYASEKKLTLRQRLELFIEVCDAVHHAHQKGILHRDLKPQNILIDLNGRVKVIDFGIARAVDADQVPATLQTSPDQLLGTLQYMSPEQLEGDPRELDARADVYALGVVLYELICGRLPYAAAPSRLPDAIKFICEQPLTRPHTANEQIRGDLETVLLTALHKDRTRRYHTAGDLAQDIRKVLNDEPILARQDSATYVVRTRLRAAVMRHRWVSLAAGIIVGFVVAELVGRAIDRWGEFDVAYPCHLIPMFTPTPANDLGSVHIISMRSDMDTFVLPDGRTLGAAATTQPWTKRWVHAQLLEKVAESGARVVAFDMGFKDDSPADDQFLAAILRAKAAGIDIVGGTRTWDLEQDGRPAVMNPRIARELKWGVVTIQMEGPDPWGADLVLRRRGGDPLPSFGLVTAGAFWHRLAPLTYTLESDPDMVCVRHGSGVPEEVPFSFSSKRTDQLDKLSQYGILEGDTVGQFLLAIPPQAVLDKSTISYVEVLLSTKPSELRKLFADKVVVIGEERKNSNDPPHEYYDGRMIYGLTAHAVAIDSILSGRVILLAGNGVHWLLDVLGALAGVAIGLLVARGWLRACCLAAFILTLLYILVLLYRTHLVIVEPLVAILAAITCAEVVALIERDRRRRLA